MFSAKWCGACHQVDKKKLESIGVTIVDVDTLEGSVLAAQYNVMSLPAFVNKDKAIFGAKPVEDLIEFFT